MEEPYIVGISLLTDVNIYFKDTFCVAKRHV